MSDSPAAKAPSCARTRIDKDRNTASTTETLQAVPTLTFVLAPFALGFPHQSDAPPTLQADMLQMAPAAQCNLVLGGGTSFLAVTDYLNIGQSKLPEILLTR